MTPTEIRSMMDRRLAPLQASRSAMARPAAGWVSAIRTALGMSTSDLAGRLGVSPVAVRKLQASERAGTTRLETLARAADAMGCDLVYAFVPRTSLEDFVEQRAGAVVGRELDRVDNTMALEDQRATEQDRSSLREESMRRVRNSRTLWRDET